VAHSAGISSSQHVHLSGLMDNPNIYVTYDACLCDCLLLTPEVAEKLFVRVVCACACVYAYVLRCTAVRCAVCCRVVRRRPTDDRLVCVRLCACACACVLCAVVCVCVCACRALRSRLRTLFNKSRIAYKTSSRRKDAAIKIAYIANIL